MKLIAVLIISVVFIQNTIAQRPYFNTEKDLLMAQFDLKPDEDDVYAAAALACMLQHADFKNVKHYVVAGAYGIQDGSFVEEAVPGLYNMLFGLENTIWTDAHANWDASVTWITAKVKPIIKAGGKVFVQEAGQSDITHDWCKKLISEGVSASLIKEHVIVVQHSKWNENHTDQSKLSWVKENTAYFKIADGNKMNETPSFKNGDPSYLSNAISENNTNAFTRSAWLEAKRVCEDYEASWENPSIAKGGLDFSDCVENWWIFDLSNSVTNTNTFWNKYVLCKDNKESSL